MRSTPLLPLLLLCVSPLLFSACSSSSSAPQTTNGVNDVLKACQLRAAWTKGSSASCNECLSLANTPKCACLADKPFDALCTDQAVARQNEPTCTGTDTCVAKCAATDCACVEGCYANAPKCKPLAAADDGCLAATCEQYCK